MVMFRLRDQCLGKIEVPLSDQKIWVSNGPADIVQALSPVEGTEGRATGDLRVTVVLLQGKPATPS